MAVEGVIRPSGTPAQTAPSPKSGGAPPSLGGSRGPGVSKPAVKPPVEVEVQKASSPGPAVVNANATFSVDDATGLITIKLVNAQTGELIRQIPPREYVELVLSSGSPKGTLFEART